MGRKSEQIVQQIEQERSHLGDDLHALEQQIKAKVSGRWMPVLAVAGIALGTAMFVGFLIGRAVRS